MVSIGYGNRPYSCHYWLCQCTVGGMASTAALQGVNEVEMVNGEIRALMGRHRVSQKMMAAWLGLPQSQISKRLAGGAEWRLSEIFRVAEAFDVPAGLLLGGNTKAPRREGVGLPIDAVRHQGLEPRTRWLRVSDDGVVVELVPQEPALRLVEGEL